MASKLYTYYISGSELAILEYDETKGTYISPLTDVVSGLEIEYVGQPFDLSGAGANYINNLEKFNIADGTLLLINEGQNYFGEDDENRVFEVSNCKIYPELNGLFKTVKIYGITGAETVMQCIPINNTMLHTDDFSATDIIDLGTITQVAHLENEESIIPVDENLSRALTYYVRAKLMEDQGNIQMKEYWMREYNRYVSENEDRKIWGPRIIVPNSHAIKK